MATNPGDPMPDARLDPKALYREETFTDRKVGAIRRLTPVKADGSPDPARPVLFLGQAQLLTAVGALPLSFEIQAATLEEALAKFPEATKASIERTMRELQEMRRQAASSIVIPEAGGSFGGGFPPAGGGGGGKIKLP
jgi:hypothetical protein